MVGQCRSGADEIHTTIHHPLRLANWWWLRAPRFTDVVKKRSKRCWAECLTDDMSEAFLLRAEYIYKKRKVFTSWRLSENDILFQDLRRTRRPSERRSWDKKKGNLGASARVWLFSLLRLDCLRGFLKVVYANSRRRLHVCANYAKLYLANPCECEWEKKKYLINCQLDVSHGKDHRDVNNLKIESKRIRIQWLAKQWYIIESIPLQGAGDGFLSASMADNSADKLWPEKKARDDDDDGVNIYL